MPIIKDLGVSRKKLGPFIYFGLLPLLLLIVAIPFTDLAHATFKASTGPPEVRVGSELEFPPYAFVDQHGQPAGFSVDLIKTVAAVMGLPIKISTGPWDTVWKELVAGRIDVLPIVAKSPERRLLVDFSLAHTETYDAFFVRKGDHRIQNIEAARGKEIVVMRSDAAHHALLERNFQGRLILVETIPVGLSLIASGKHDAFLCSKLIGTMVIQEHGLRNLAAGPLIPDYKRVFSFAVKKGDTELLEKLNQGLLIIKTTHEYDRIYEKWLTADDPWRKWQKYLWPAIIIMIVSALVVGFWLVMLQRLVKKRTYQLSESNEMLRLAQEGLEERVTQRTAELTSANVALQSEIAERQRAEVALRESEDRFRKIFENAATGIAITDWEGRFQRCNPAYCILLGYNEEELRRIEFPSLIYPEDRDANLAKIRRLQAGEQPFFQIENRYVRKDGQPVWVHKFVSVLPDATGRPVHLVALVTDVTERRRAEEALRRAHEELEQRVVERTADLHHTVEQLHWEITERQQTEQSLRESEERLRFLASQLLTAQETERKRLSRELHDELGQTLLLLKFKLNHINAGLYQSKPELGEECQEALQYLNGMVDEVRRLSRDLSPAPLEHLGFTLALKHLFSEFCRHYKISKHSMEIENLDDCFTSMAQTNIYRLLQEALTNIGKHAGATSIAVTGKKENSRVSFTVKDNGKGFLVSEALARKADLKGIGLVAMQERLRLMDGTLKIWSREGVGTEVTFTVPIRTE